METEAARDLRTYTIAAVLNTASGSCTPENAEEMKSIFKEAGLENLRLLCGHSETIDQMLTDASDAEILVVLGGDGTIRTAAARSTHTSSILIPLPGGTMNILPKALYGQGTWQEILRTILASPQIKNVSGGEVAGERFFIAAICGAPALWTHAREALRESNLGNAIEHGKEALRHMFSEKINYHFDEMNEGTAEALVVTCPLVATTLTEDRQVLEAAVIEVNRAGEVIELAAAAAFRSWHESKNVAVVRTSNVRVSSDQDIPLILDGETIDAGKELEITFVPDAFRVLVGSSEPSH